MNDLKTNSNLTIGNMRNQTRGQRVASGAVGNHNKLTDVAGCWDVFRCYQLQHAPLSTITTNNTTTVPPHHQPAPTQPSLEPTKFLIDFSPIITTLIRQLLGAVIT